MKGCWTDTTVARLELKRMLSIRSLCRCVVMVAMLWGMAIHDSQATTMYDLESLADTPRQSEPGLQAFSSSQTLSQSLLSAASNPLDSPEEISLSLDEISCPRFSGTSPSASDDVTLDMQLVPEPSTILGCAFGWLVAMGAGMSAALLEREVKRAASSDFY